MRFNWIQRGKLTQADGQMKINVTSLLDCPRGSAWPSSVRTVKRSVKSMANETRIPICDPHVTEAHHRETASVTRGRSAGNDGSVCPECLGLRHATKDRTMGSHAERRRLRNLF